MFPRHWTRPSPGVSSSLAAAWILGTSCAPGVAQVPPPPAPAQDLDRGTIQVVGQAQVQVPTERMSISFGVETESESAREASSLNAERMEAVISALRGAGVEGLEIETYGYALNPEYRAPSRDDPTRRTISGYRAMNHIRVKVPRLEEAGEVLDIGIGAGANRVVDLRFEAGDTRDARLQALRDAVGSAREEAQVIADAMGVVLGPPLEVRGGASPGEPRVVARMAMAEAMVAPSTPIEPGRQTVTASVTITYRILEGGR